ncbi:MAG TPA: trehalose-6-phosphate synthase [Pseudolabrys sp.]|uniref:alpha,alpha-trehalose-phosphate synthase (UDP-forming) n=1 Tax=Pseudolabrys sp. TaxID=1960880 RepID=UPI002DDD9655|nr:trehalose-6-phosphate synthase [Pseudolabrys sp.]HEV2628760.1 trehalose-6-phosphate synthase [Pseudolabrys sp.]
MPRLVVVSNRVGIPDGGTRAGGLEVAIRPALKRRGGVWFGWSGKITDEEPGKARTTLVENVSYVTVDMLRDDHEEFYNGFANRVLWPILHYRLDLAEFSRRDLGGYFRVNEYFARNLENLLRPDDVVWVHDYHLIPLARALRDRGHKNKIGFFIHIPCPPPEILTALPNHERLIPALGAYDVIGLQTETDAGNICRYFESECHVRRVEDGAFDFDGRHVRVGVFPVGVETEALARLARRAIETAFVREVLDSLSGRAMIIGVDRLDYSKGIPERLNAFESFLTHFPDWRGKVTYLQITPRSRTGIPEYADIGRVVGETAGRINGKFGEASWTPLRYINKAHSRTALAGLYRAARVGLVTPLRDGMNLVAKEYVAAQNADDPGVLILSRFAGAAQECVAALLVNPYDPEAVGAAINRALGMPLAERRERHAHNFRVLVKNDLTHWAERFLSALEGRPAPAPVQYVPRVASGH